MRLRADVALTYLIIEVDAVATELEAQAEGASGSEEAVMLRMAIKLREAAKAAEEKR